MSLPEQISFTVHKYSERKLEELSVNVSTEYHVTLKINNRPVVSIACSGTDLELLALGHLIGEGILYGEDEIEGIQIDEENLEINVITKTTDEIIERLFRIHSIASGCGQGRMHSPDDKLSRTLVLPTIDAETVLSCMQIFLRSSDLHKNTRGVHSAALYTTAGERLVFFDEIGRHNAVDKIIGYIKKAGLSVQDKMIFSTGRLSSEIVYKTIHASIPVIISKSAPTSASIELARKYNIIFIGNVRKKQFTIFHGYQNITF